MEREAAMVDKEMVLRDANGMKSRIVTTVAATLDLAEHLRLEKRVTSHYLRLRALGAAMSIDYTEAVSSRSFGRTSRPESTRL